MRKITNSLAQGYQLILAGLMGMLAATPGLVLFAIMLGLLAGLVARILYLTFMWAWSLF